MKATLTVFSCWSRKRTGMTNKSRMRPPKFKITAEETEGENHAFHET